MKMATLADVGTCITNLKARLAAAGFKVPPGPDADNQTWAAAALLAGQTTAHKLAGRQLTAKDAAGQAAERIAACNAVVAALAQASTNKPDLRQLVLSQQDMVTPQAEKQAAARFKMNVGLGLLTTVLAAAAGVGLYYTLRS